MAGRKTKTSLKRKRLVLLDAHAIIHRAFHALPELTNLSGEQMGATYGFATILLRIIQELKPDYLLAAFDMPGPTFRHVAYEKYKAQRPPAPHELIGQFLKVRELCRAFGIPILESPGYEADDVIGTIVHRLMAEEKDLEIVIVTGDLDTLQLVRPGVSVYTMRKGVTDTVIYDEKAVKARYGLTPRELPDYKGLRGDPSDNIPGVKGIGEKTAALLIKTYGSIEKLYRILPKAKISASVKEKLEKEKEEAFFSKTLATINTEAPVEVSLADAVWKGAVGKSEIEKLFRAFGFNSLLKRLGYLEKEEIAERSESLFPETGPAPGKAESIPRAADFSRETRLGFFLEEGKSYLLTSHELYELPEGLLRQASFQKTLSEKRERIFFDQKKFLKAAGAIEGRPAFGEARPGGRPQDFDILIAVYLLHPGERSYTLERAAREAAIAASGSEAMRKAFAIAETLRERLKQRKLWDVFFEIEMPLVPILAEIEERGMLLDLAFLKELSGRTKKNLQKIEKEIFKIAGREFNVASPKQVGEVLFEALELESKGIRKTEGGAISTDAGELMKIKDKHPIIPKILEHREIAKLLGTYVDALPELASGPSSAKASEGKGTLHTTLNQTLTSTGRLSSSNPNLQNIPIRTEVGREIRKAFVARPGYQLVSFDYSQIELRVAAAMSGDEKMQEAFREGKDIHALTAMEVNNVKSLEDVTPAMRSAAKALNFGILYGMGPRAFSETAGIPFPDAKKFMAEYFADFPRIKEFMASTLQQARSKGYVETMLGRRRYIPEINSPNWRVRAEAERMAMNAPIQGTATGDIVKLAMIKVHRYFKESGIRNQESGHILMQVHDELLCEIKQSQVKKVVPQVRAVMESIYDIGVPLVVDAKVGPNWGEMKKM